MDITNDKSIIEIKHKAMTEMAKLAWKGELSEEAKEKALFRILPGPKPSYRCCIYKEREVMRQRFRLACGLNADPSDPTDAIVQVIKPACDDCPIQSYTVTDSCRFCLGKACMNTCRFGALQFGEGRMRIDTDKCKECGMCAKACPYGAIVHLERPCKKSCAVGAITYDEYGFCQIDEKKCISCGRCIHNCPFGAIGSRVRVVDVINEIKAGKEVIAMCAPATEGQFGKEISMASIKILLKKLGFSDMVEVGLGGDMTAAYEAAEWAEAYKEGRKMTTSCCSAFINMMKQHFPKQYEENMSSTVSPMVAVSRYLKATHPGCVTVFVGPCIAKKSEAADKDIPDNADYVLTYGELHALMLSKDVDFEPTDESYQEASVFGKKFAGTGGVAAAVIEVMQERGEDVSGIKLLRCSGGAECYRGLQLLKAGRMQEDFMEGMCCPGGCVGGPSRHATDVEVEQNRKVLLSHADARKILPNLENYPMERFSMHRDGHMDI